MKRLAHYTACGMVFISGVVVCANLSRLIEVNPFYEAGWGKIVFALVLGVFFSIKAVED